MARRKKEDALETRERITDAAIAVFHERGVARPSLTDIAELAGVTRGAVYGHFKNKADLINALTSRVRLPADALCETDCEHIKGDPLGQLRERWSELFQEVARNREWQQIFDIIFHRIELVTESGEIRERVERGHNTAIDLMRNLLTLAVDAEQLPGDVDVELASRLMHGALIGVLRDWLITHDDYDLVSLAERTFDAVVDAMRLSSALHRDTPAFPASNL